MVDELDPRLRRGSARSQRYAPPIERVELTRSQIDRAGTTLRRFVRSSPRDWSADVADAMRVARLYRGQHGYPLTKVTVGLRQFIVSELGDLGPLPPAQRLKRMEAIIAKLGRQSVRLSQMEDIGGCRAVLMPFALPGVAARIRRVWHVVSDDDYISTPKPDGYRALHLVVRRDYRLIEIQLRTPGPQVWSELVDDLTSRSPYDVKHGEGPDELHRHLRDLASLLAGIEDGSIPSDDASTSELVRLVAAAYELGAG